MVAYADYASDSRIRREAESLVSRGDTVDVICVGTGESRTRINGVSIYPVNVIRYRGEGKFRFFLSYFKFFLLAFSRLTRLHFSRRYGVVHVHNIPDCLVFAAVLPRLYGARIILDLHDPMPEGFMVKYRLSHDHPFIRFLRWLEVASAGFADRVLCVSEQHRRVFVSHGISPAKLSVLMNLPDERIFGAYLSRTKSPGFELVYHGTLTHRLGIDIALRAVDIVRREVKDVVFNIYGSGEFYPFLKDLVEELDIQDHVHMSGRVHPIDEIPRLVGSAHAGIVSNRKNLITNLMMPVKLIEYIALGIPVIAARLNTIEHYFGDFVSLFDPGDHHDLASCILEFYYKPEKAERLAEEAISFLQTLNWKNETDKFYRLIDGLLQGGPTLP